MRTIILALFLTILTPTVSVAALTVHPPPSTITKIAARGCALRTMVARVVDPPEGPFELEFPAWTLIEQVTTITEGTLQLILGPYGALALPMLEALDRCPDD